MSEYQEIFADGVGEITLSGGMVRMDLFTITAKQGEDEQQPKVQINQRVIFPPDGFLRSFSAMEDLVKKLVEAGIIKRREETQGGSDGSAVQTGNSEATSPPKSPNF